MSQTYRKVATIKAEQFNGSVEMMVKYNIHANPAGHYCAGLPLYMLPTKEGDMKINIGDWIATGVDGEHWAIANDIFKRTYERVGGNS